MTLVETYHAQHRARLARMGAPVPHPIRRCPAPPKPDPYKFNFGWNRMWFYDLVMEGDPPPHVIRIRDIQKTVCSRYNIAMVDLLSPGRTLDITLPRQIAMYLCRLMLQTSYPEIGRRFGNRDHTTVIHAFQKVGARIVSTPEFASEIESLKEELRS